jgi:hypothetical protein
MLLEPPDTIPLTNAERTRLAELESGVERTLNSFLECGRALCEIRNKRLYRGQYGTWEDYCTRKWGLGYSRANDLIRSTEVAEHLLSGPAAPGKDAVLALNLSADTLRPLQKLEPELQSAVWRLASRVSEHPTQHVVSKIVRVVQRAINEGASGNNGTATKPTPPASEKKVFVLALLRLSESRIPACMIVAGIDEARARKLRLGCQTMIGRCHEILESIRSEFPML